MMPQRGDRDIPSAKRAQWRSSLCLQALFARLIQR